MTYEQIVAMMQTYYKDADASKVEGHYAVQCNVTGEGEGAFYIELADGKVNVQPFDYVDRNAAVNAAADTFKAVTEGKASYTDAVNDSRITIEGDANAAAVLDSVAVKTEEKKAAPAAKAVEQKAEPAVKAEEKKAAPAAKAEEKKAEPAVKAEEKKAEPAVKAEEKKAAPAAKAEEKKAEPAVKAEAKTAETEAKAAPKTAAKTTAKKAPARKRAVSKAASNSKAGKGTKKTAK